MARRNGFILPSVLAVLAVSFLVGALALVLVLGNLRGTQAAIVTTRAQLAAEAGLEEAAAFLWHGIWGNTPRESRTIQHYVALVSERTFPVTLNGTLPDGTSFVVRIEALSPQTDSGNRLVGYRFRARSEGYSPQEGVRILEQEFLVARRFFPFDYALLTNNVNCIFCHARISSMDRLRGDPDPNNRATWWRRAKVATLEHVEARVDTNTTIHGTLYTRGNITLRTGSDNAQPTLYSTLQDGQEEIRSTAQRQVGRHFQPTNCSGGANCPSRRPMYANYPTSSSLGGQGWPDGELVDSFPLPIPDANGNRRIDDGEWQAAIQGSLEGSSDDYPPGTLRARMAVLTSPQTTLDWGIASTSQEVQTGSLASPDQRRLVVIDAQTQPLEIRGTVFINGDVILRGRVRGDGTILARGNIYVMGDLVYDCGQGSQTANCDYRDPSRLPALNLVAGGNVVIGDYLSRFRLPDDRIPGAEWAGNLNLPTDVEAGFEGGFPPGTFQGCADFRRQKPSNISEGQWTLDPRNTQARCTVPNLVAMEVGNFNRLELLRASQNPNYVPRFYRFDGDDGIFYYHGCWEHTRDYAAYHKVDGRSNIELSCTGNNDSFRGTINLPAQRVQELLSRAVVVDVHPGWLPKEVMKALWIQSVQGNPARRPASLRIDGMIYTPNAVFSLAPGDGGFSRQNGDQSKVLGRIDHRGGIVAADTGILAPGGFDLYHDSRLRPRVPYDQNLSLFRQAWQVKSR